MIKQWIFESLGAPDEVLQLQDVEKAVLKPGQVRVRILAAPINPADLNFIAGTYGVKPELPARPGLEGCGEVIESGDEAFPVGQRVILLEQVGTWAEEVVVESSALVGIDAAVPVEQAAMLKVNPMTAFRLLEDFVDLQAGDWVIQNASNSGVGRCVIQLARQRGIKTLNLVRRPELIAELKALGADEVLLDDRDAVDGWRQANPQAAVRLAGNAVGGDSALRMMSALSPRGCMVTYGAMALKPLKVPNGFLIFKRLRLEGLWVTEWIKETPPAEREQAYGALATALAEGRLKQAIHAEYAFQDLKQAVAEAQTEGRRGKLIVRCDR